MYMVMRIKILIDRTPLSTIFQLYRDVDRISCYLHCVINSIGIYLINCFLINRTDIDRRLLII
jgi:hypothetical protein